MCKKTWWTKLNVPRFFSALLHFRDQFITSAHKTINILNVAMSMCFGVMDTVQLQMVRGNGRVPSSKRQDQLMIGNNHEKDLIRKLLEMLKGAAEPQWFLTTSQKGDFTKFCKNPDEFRIHKLVIGNCE